MNVLLKAKKAFETMDRNDVSIFAQPNVGILGFTM